MAAPKKMPEGSFKFMLIFTPWVEPVINGHLEIATAIMDVKFPNEVIGLFLRFLALGGASKASQRLAYLTTKDPELKNIADTMQRPLVIDIEIEDGGYSKSFTLPFAQATVAQIEIDWGDGSIDIVREAFDTFFLGASQRCASHEYKEPGQYTVRVWPAQRTGAAPVASLDHLGWLQFVENEEQVRAWWKSLRALCSLGNLGIRSLSYLFVNADRFNAPLDHLDVSAITNMTGMFYDAPSFNQPIASWNVTNVTNMSYMFHGAALFNQPIGEWNVSNVTDMQFMFRAASAFNQPIDNWDVSKVTNMKFMFDRALSFNQPIGSWDVSNVTDMSSMFLYSCSFNQPIGSWDVSKVTNMNLMFGVASAFNQPIGSWNVGNVIDMGSMFRDAVSFNQPIDGWNVRSATNMRNILDGCKLFSHPLPPGWRIT
jgi:surface protein